MDLHVAFFPHTLSNTSVDGLHTKAQYFAPEDDDNAHSGFAVTPGGTSVGQLPLLSHGGEQFNYY